jgi:hypothetical protein
MGALGAEDSPGQNQDDARVNQQEHLLPPQDGPEEKAAQQKQKQKTPEHSHLRAVEEQL